MKELKVELTFTEEVLGTASNDPEIHEEFIASKAKERQKDRAAKGVKLTEEEAKALAEEEVAAIDAGEVIEKSKTVFPKLEDGTPFFWDYQIKGFFKDTCGMLRKVPKTESSKVKAYKKEIDGLIFIKERRIPAQFEGEIGSCQRPLRGQTAQGERIALANSETIPAGTKIAFTVQCFVDSQIDLVKEWLDYGAFRGIGQWRNSGKGKFTWREIAE